MIFSDLIWNLVIERIDLSWWKIWVMYVTSSIGILIEVSKRRFCRFSWNCVKKTLTWPNFQHIRTKTDPTLPIIFTELYRKSGNCHEVKIRIFRFSPRVLSEIPRLLSEITPRGIADPTLLSILIIEWLVTWYGKKHFYISYFHNLEEKIQR